MNNGMKRHIEDDGTPFNAKKKRDVQFATKPINRFDKKYPYFRQPTEFGCFSLDSKREFHNDDRLLRYYNEPSSARPLDFDLRVGYDTCIKKNDDVEERLKNLLLWIKDNKKKFVVKDSTNKKSSNLNTDFISWRGHFTKFLLTPYENREAWKMGFCLYNGTIFISEIETDNAKEERKNRSERHEEMCYWGYKFEDYVTESIHKNHPKSDIVNTNEAYGCVIRTRLEHFSILLGADVDCCRRNSNKKPPANYIELKTSRILYKYKQKTNFARYKLKKFWAQSFLSGVPEIIVGFRDDDGIVKELKTYPTLEIPKLVRQYGDVWDARFCLVFLNDFLTWVKEIVTIDNPDVVYIFSFDEPFNKINYHIVDDGSERFLPTWFTEDSDAMSSK